MGGEKRNCGKSVKFKKAKSSKVGAKNATFQFFVAIFPFIHNNYTSD